MKTYTYVIFFELFEIIQYYGQYISYNVINYIMVRRITAYYNNTICSNII